MPKVPEFDSPPWREVNGMHHRFATAAGSGNILRSFRHDLVAISQNSFESQRLLGRFEMLEVTIDVQPRVMGQHVLRLGENVLDEYARNNSQRHFAINPSESQVIDLVTERGNIGAVGGVKVHDQDVFAVEIEVRG